MKLLNWLQEKRSLEENMKWKRHFTQMQLTHSTCCTCVFPVTFLAAV